MAHAIYTECLYNYIVASQTLKRAASTNDLGSYGSLQLDLANIATDAETEVDRKVDVWDSIFAELIPGKL